ncbi:GtrA family protein [Pseudoclavibacter sp. 13-3]|uniref:GtrA family protein n=1 Tax=Pseudoclavibacter sp. 13-3 TaxID=2901228 RepID=UPI001E343C43|nr:GtrA family protein [Pseudoclavibacter sp. 13-3]MCD7101220.1 GtrA family protein [Pseudoclavibacter sp. 13-3]
MSVRQTQLRFLLIGGMNTLIDFGLLFALVALGVHTIPANIISTGIAFVVSFFANRSYTFKACQGSLPRQMALFVLVTLFALWVLQPLVITLVSPVIANLSGHRLNDGAVLLIAKLLATGVSMMWNYILYAKVVFPASARSSDQRPR